MLLLSPSENFGQCAYALSLQDLQSKTLPNTRIQPDRRWFGNTRVIGQKQLDQFRDEMSAKVSSNVAWPSCVTILCTSSSSPGALHTCTFATIGWPVLSARMCRSTTHTQSFCGRRSYPWLFWKIQKASAQERLCAPASCRPSHLRRLLALSRRGRGLACQQRHTRTCWGMLPTTVPSAFYSQACHAACFEPLVKCVMKLLKIMK